MQSQRPRTKNKSALDCYSYVGKYHTTLYKWNEYDKKTRRVSDQSDAAQFLQNELSKQKTTKNYNIGQQRTIDFYTAKKSFNDSQFGRIVK